MGTISFNQDDYPFELMLQMPPTATAEGENVVVTLPVYVPGFPQQTARVRMPLSIPHGRQLLDQLRDAFALADQNSRLAKS